MKVLRTILALLVVVGGFGLAGEARAQGAAPDTAPPVPLPELTVTVLRTPIGVGEAPAAVDAVRRPAAERARPGLGLDEAFRGTAGVQVDNRYNFALGNRLSVRGFGARSQFGVRGVRVVIDGIPATLPDGQTTLDHVDPSEIGRVEVVRGPSSSLYGNAAGGVVQLESLPPPSVPFRQEFGALSGSDGLLRLSGTTSGRAGRSSYRFTVTRLGYDGYREYASSENAYLNGHFGYERGEDEFRLVVGGHRYDARNPGSLSAAQLAEDRTQAHGFNRQQRTGKTGHQAQLGGVWRRRSGERESEVSVHGLARRLENPLPTAIIDLDRAVLGTRALLRSRAVVAGREVRWVVGGEFDIQRDDRSNHANQGGGRGELRLDQFETVRAAGAFAQVAARLGGRLRLLGGLRLDAVDFEVEDRFIGDGDPDDSGSRRMHALSPSAGVLYEVADGASVYVNVATSFETPTTTELANRPTGEGGFNPELEPQRATSFEAGLTGRWGAGLRYQVAAYRARVEDALIPFEVPAAPGRLYYRNAGSAVHRGAEASVSIELPSGLSGRFAYTYTDARFDAYVVGDDRYDGNRIPGVAPYRADLALTYRAAGGWYVGADYRRVSRTPVNDSNRDASPGYQLVDLRAGVDGFGIGRVELSPFAGVTNLLDEAYNTAVTVNAAGDRFYEPGPGRAVYLGLNVAFGAR